MKNLKLTEYLKNLKQKLSFQRTIKQKSQTKSKTTKSKKSGRK